MKTIFGYTYQKLAKGGLLFQGGGMTKRGVVKTRRTPVGNKKGVLTEKYEGTRVDSKASINPYTKSGKGQSQAIIDANNKLIEDADLQNYQTADEIADDFRSGKLTKVQAQILTQKLMNKYSDNEIYEAISKGELKPGDKKSIGGFEFHLDKNNRISADRSKLNPLINLSKDLRYNTGQYTSDLEFENVEPRGKKFTYTVELKYDTNGKTPYLISTIYNPDGSIAKKTNHSMIGDADPKILQWFKKSPLRRGGIEKMEVDFNTMRNVFRY